MYSRTGLFGSLKTLATTLVGVGRTRLELLSTDIAEELAHVTALAVWGLIALFCLGMGVVLLAILIVVASWESFRFLALGALTAIFLVSAAVLAGYAMRAVTRMRPFEATRTQLSRDRQRVSSSH